MSHGLNGNRRLFLLAAFATLACVSTAQALQPSTSTASKAVRVSTSSDSVEVSTATGESIRFDNQTGVVVIEGNAMLESSSGTVKADKIRANTKTSAGRAEGNVILEQPGNTLTGSEAEYYWDASTGVIHGAEGSSPPWRYWAEELYQVSPQLYRLRDGSITSCDLDPPHYRIRGTRGKVVVGRRATMTNARFVAEDLPVFYSPWYTRSLIPKKYTLRLEPGSNSRDGLTNRTILGYPFSPNTFTKFRWDYLQRTGNGGGIEHRYFTPDIQGNFDSYLVRDYNPDPQPGSRRYSILWNHFQRFTPRLTANARMDVKSDQTFGNEFQNVGNDVRVENQVRGVFSEGGLTYQFSKATLLTQFDRRDRFDSSVSSSNFISKLTLPRLTFNTIPLSSKYLPFYTSFTGSFLNETLERSSPRQTLRYQRSASAGIQIKRDIRIKKKTTLTPLAGYTESWSDRDTSTKSEKDVYRGRYDLGMDVRRRFGRKVDATVGHRYGVRLAANSTRIDDGTADRGIDTNALSASVLTRIGRDTRITLSSGYDMRNAPRDNPSQYRHESARFSPPVLDIEYRINRKATVYFRETYSIFDTRTGSPVNTPLNTSGELQLGDLTSRTFFSQGFSYTKPSPGNPSELILNNKAKFYLTPKWYLDVMVSYRALAPGNQLNYSKIKPIERSVNIARDLHCWILRMQFSRRPDRSEASFHIDLKANMNSIENFFGAPADRSLYTYRDTGSDLADVFPAPDPDDHLLKPSNADETQP